MLKWYRDFLQKALSQDHESKKMGFTGTPVSPTLFSFFFFQKFVQLGDIGVPYLHSNLGVFSVVVCGVCGVMWCV